jgi:hypothetical protein
MNRSVDELIELDCFCLFYLFCQLLNCFSMNSFRCICTSQTILDSEKINEIIICKYLESEDLPHKSLIFFKSRVPSLS